MKPEMPNEIWAFKTQKGETVFSGDKRLTASNATKYVRADIAENKGVMKCFYEESELPKVFIAIYGDGSGCNIFSEHAEYKGLYTGLSIDFDPVDRHWLTDAGYLWFIALPDDFNVFGVSDGNR